MTVFPVMLDGSKLSALVVGGGAVAARKTRGLLDGGARVTVVAPAICDELHRLASGTDRLAIEVRPYAAGDVERADLVVAATDDAAVNACVATDARTRRRLVNVVDDPDGGNFITASVHRAGDLTIAVSTGRTPAAAAAIRTELARRFDGRYASAIDALRGLRDRLLSSGRRDEWKRASSELSGDTFCAEAEQGTIVGKVESWR